MDGSLLLEGDTTLWSGVWSAWEGWDVWRAAWVNWASSSWDNAAWNGATRLQYEGDVDGALQLQNVVVLLTESNEQNIEFAIAA